MKLLNLEKTKALMQQKEENQEFDSYAVYVRYGDYEATMTSDIVNEDTYFDMASCGKVLVTSSLVLQAIAQGKLSLEDTIDTFFDAVPEDKKTITIKHLLTHTSGIIRHRYSPSLAGQSHDAFAKEILAQPLAFAVGSDYTYSCSGMVLLGFILEKVYQTSLEQVFETQLKKPLGYTRSRFNIAVDEPNSAKCYHTKTMDGYTSPWDDNNIRVLQTSAGSGGQFFTLADVKKFVKAVLEQDERLYPKETFALAEQNHAPSCAKESRGLGWLYVDEKYHQTGKLFEDGSFGHCGWSGQSIFFNRARQMCVVILTNATRFLYRKNGWNSGADDTIIHRLREQIHNEIYSDLKAQNLI